MRNFSIKNNTGIGLVEVLVSTVVIALGLLSVASLQGGLMSESGENKTRSECLSLANTKIEQFRDRIDKDGATGYETLASSAADEVITGINQVFTRSWVVTSPTNPDRKEVIVTTSWWGAGDTDAVKKNKQCMIQSIITYDNIGNSAAAANGSTGGVNTSPSTNAESSDEISEYIDLPSASTVGVIVTIDGKDYIAQDQVTLDNGDIVQKGVLANLCSGYSGLTDLSTSIDSYSDPQVSTVKVRRINFDGVTGNEAIELFELGTGAAAGYCIPRIRFNGGVMIPVQGTVYSKATDGNGGNALPLDVKLFTFNASETGAYCIFSPAAGATQANYVCYVGGNCNNFSGTTDDSNMTSCPDGSYAATKVGPGGWRGKVGLLGVASKTSGGKNVCFAEEIAGTPVTLDTARNYYARHNGINEGINQAYSCHNFLIINGQSTNLAVHNECVSEGVGIVLASKISPRAIADNDSNLFNPLVNESSCSSGTGSHIVTVTLNASGGVPAGGTLTSDFASCTGTGLSYSCTELDSQSGQTASWGYSETIAGDHCSGSMSHGTSGSDYSFAFNVTCAPVRTVNVSAVATASSVSVTVGAISNLVFSGAGASCSSFITNNSTDCEVPSSLAVEIFAEAICQDTGALLQGSVLVGPSTNSASIDLGICDAAINRYVITSVSDDSNWVVTNATCDSGLCSNLVAGSYDVAITLFKSAGSKTNTCNTLVDLVDADKVVTVSGVNGSSLCSAVSQ